jgi:glycine cleavage system H protein
VQAFSNVRYSTDHLWVLVVGESARIGVTSRFGGPIESLVLPKVGDSVRRDEPLGWALDGSTRRALVSPISGTVVLVNEMLTGDAHPVVSDPYAAGWLIECQLSYDETLESVMDPAAYRSLP